MATNSRDEPGVPRSLVDRVNSYVEEGGLHTAIVSGDSTLMIRAAEQAVSRQRYRHAQWRVIDARARRDSSAGGARPSGVATSAWAALGAGASLALPAAGLVTALMELGWNGLAARRRPDGDIQREELYDLAWDALDGAAGMAPAIVLLDAGTDETMTSMQLIVRAWAMRRSADPPDLVVLLLGARTHDGGSDSEWIGFDSIGVPVLSPQRIRDWIGPANSDVVDLILAASAGDEEEAARVWRRWRATGLVSQRGGEWSCGDGVASERVRLIERTLMRLDSPPRQDRARRLLQAASLLGDEFSVAIAAASEEGSEPEPAEDLIDDLLVGPEGSGGLVQTVRAVEYLDDGISKHLWTYRWAAPLHRYQFLRDLVHDPDLQNYWAERMLDYAVGLDGSPQLRGVLRPQIEELSRTCGKARLQALLGHEEGATEQRRAWWAWLLRSAQRLSSDPDVVRELARECGSALALGDLTTALALADAALVHIEDLPQGTEIWARLAVASCLTRCGRPSSALRLIPDAIDALEAQHDLNPETDPLLVEAFEHLARANQLTGNTDGALFASERAIDLVETASPRIRPNTRAGVYTIRCEILKDTPGRLAEAEVAARAAVQARLENVGPSPIGPIDLRATMAQLAVTLSRLARAEWPRGEHVLAPSPDSDSVRALSNTTYLLYQCLRRSDDVIECSPEAASLVGDCVAYDLWIMEGEPTIRNADDLAISLRSLASTYSSDGDAVAVPALEASLYLARECWGWDPSPRYQLHFRYSLEVLARTLRLSNATRAIEIYEELEALLAKTAHEGDIPTRLFGQWRLFPLLIAEDNRSRANEIMDLGIATARGLELVNPAMSRSWQFAFLYERAKSAKAEGDSALAFVRFGQAQFQARAREAGDPDVKESALDAIGGQIRALAVSRGLQRGIWELRQDRMELTDPVSASSLLDHRYRGLIDDLDASFDTEIGPEAEAAVRRVLDDHHAHPRTPQVEGWLRYALGLTLVAQGKTEGATRELSGALQAFSRCDALRTGLHLFLTIDLLSVCDATSGVSLLPNLGIGVPFLSRSLTPAEWHRAATAAQRAALRLETRDWVSAQMLLETSVVINRLRCEAEQTPEAICFLAVSLFELGARMDAVADGASLALLHESHDLLLPLEANPPFETTVADLENVTATLARHLIRRAVHLREERNVDEALMLLDQAVGLGCRSANPSDTMEKETAAAMLELAITVAESDRPRAIELAKASEARLVRLDGIAATQVLMERANSWRWRAKWLRMEGREEDADAATVLAASLTESASVNQESLW